MNKVQYQTDDKQLEEKQTVKSPDESAEKLTVSPDNLREQILNKFSHGFRKQNKKK